jgi:hypothetical protein
MKAYSIVVWRYAGKLLFRRPTKRRYKMSLMVEQFEEGR